MSKKTKNKKAASKKAASKKIVEGQTVSIHYVGKFDDGTEFDNSRARDKPISVELGSGQLIPGFEAALTGMAIGEVKKVKIAAEQAYGEVNPEAYQVVPHTAFPEGFEFKVGEPVYGKSEEGQQVSARIHLLEESRVTLDFNHPLAGKSLNFEIEVLNVE